VLRRVLTITAMVITGLLLQSTVFSQMKLLGVKPELMYLVTILVAVLEGPQEGAVVGFAAGLAQDFMLPGPKGLTALTLTLLGYTMGLARDYITSPSPLLPTILVAVGTTAGVIFYEIAGFLLGQLDVSLFEATKIALLTGVYGALLAPVFYPLIRRALEGSRGHRARPVRSRF
jgi:rod shape-determining protein MreD